MRIVEPTLAMFLSEIKKLEEHTFQMAEASERYLQSKKQYGQAHYTTKDWRDVLDNRLHAYKLIISNIYDIMHDRGLTNFESGPVDNDPPKYHPMKIEPQFDQADLLLFAQLMRLNPTLNIRGLDGESTINLAGSDRHSSEINTEESKGNEVSTTDLQSSGITGTSGSNEREGKASDHKRESAEAYAFAEHLF
jgi:hypothetical protein